MGAGRPAGVGATIGHWKSTVPEPNTRPKVFVDDTVLMNLLRRLEEADSADKQAFRYVLALILLRKKLVRFDGSDGDTWLLTPKLDPAKGPMSKWNEDETLRVLDPRLDEAGIEAVTRQLNEILEGEL